MLVGDGALEKVGFELQAGRGTFTFELGPDYRDYQHAVLRDPFRVVVDLYRRTPYTGPVNRNVASAEPGRAPLPGALPAPAAGAATPPAADVAGAPPAGAASGALPPLGAIPAPGSGDASGGGSRSGQIRTVVVDAGHGGG